MSESSNIKEGSALEKGEETVLSFYENDPENPYNWSSVSFVASFYLVLIAETLDAKLKKLYIEFIGTILVLNSTVASSIPSGAQEQLQQRFDVSQENLVLPTSIFLIGYILGPIIFSPMSETSGRRVVLLPTFMLYLIFDIAICFSPNWAAFIVFRLLTGIFASPAISVTGGLYADIYDDRVQRGRAMAWFMTAASFGPVLGPIASGYLAPYGWKWPFWFNLIFAGASALVTLTLPETLGSAILRKRAEKLRKSSVEANMEAAVHVDTTQVWQAIKSYAGRPLRMLFTEPIVFFSCLFLSLIYAIFYLFFDAYPIIFGSTYNFSEGEVGLAFLPSNLLGLPVYLYWDVIFRHAQERGSLWTKKEENSRLPLALIGGPFFPAGLFWLGWTAQKDIHWIVPVLSGLPVGFGFVLIFMALINYMTDAYKVYAASALGAASMARSAFGVALPFATHAMFSSLGIPWACSLLGFISLLMILIPFAFLKWGSKIRENSRMCQELAQQSRRGS